MERRRQREPGSEDPEEGPLRIEVPECRPGHDGEHEHRVQVTRRPRSRQDGFDDGEGPLVRAPVFRVGGETGPKGGSRSGIGEMKEDQDHGTRRRQARPVPAGEGRKRDDGRQLGEGRESQRRTHRPRCPGSRCETRAGGAGTGVGGNGIGAAGKAISVRGSGIGRAGNGIGVRPVRGAGGPGSARETTRAGLTRHGVGPHRGRRGEENQDHEQEDAERLEMTAPCGLDHQQRGPREEHEGPGNGASGPAGHLRDQQTRGQVGGRPRHLEREHRPAHERARREHHLREGRVYGGEGRVVDARVPGGANRFEFGRVRCVQIGVDARQLHMSVP